MHTPTPKARLAEARVALKESAQLLDILQRSRGLVAMRKDVFDFARLDYAQACHDYLEASLAVQRERDRCEALMIPPAGSAKEDVVPESHFAREIEEVFNPERARMRRFDEGWEATFGPK